MIGICSDCKKEADLRPYGKDGAYICFDCGMKDKPNTEQMFRQAKQAELDANGFIVIGDEDVGSLQ